MRKVSALYSIEPRSPLIVYRLKNSGSYGADRPECFHIVRRQGYSTGIPELVTNCNRVLEYTTIWKNEEIPQPPHYKLCARCGNQEDFERALLEQHAAAAKARRQYQEAEEKRRAELDAAWEATLNAMEKLAKLLHSSGALEPDAGIKSLNAHFNREEGTFIIEIDDVTLELTQTERKLENGNRTKRTKTKAEVHKANDDRTQARPGAGA